MEDWAMKKLILLALAFVTATSAFAGGGRDSGGTAGRTPFVTANSIYAGYDLSGPVTLYLVMLGDVPRDMDEVLDKANREYFQPMLNTTLKLGFLAWSDYETKYPLILAAGDDVDIIFTAPWAFYEQEAAKGSFLELTDDFITRWMPNVAKAQSKISWMQAKSNGKIYAVPQLKTPWTYDIISIRDDLRVKYNLPEIDSWEDFEQWVLTIADNETSILANAQGGGWFMYMQQAGVLNAGYPVQFIWRNQGNTDPAPEDISFSYTSDVFRDFSLQMATWMERGVWSRNVMNNTISRSDLFIQGKSATVYWNSMVFSLGKTMEDNGLGRAGYYDVNPKAATRRESGSTNMWAIADSSRYPERAALIIDLMKTNAGLLRLLMGGIEGRHYIDKGNGTYEPGPEASNYPFNGWTWALNSPEALTEAYDTIKYAQRYALDQSIEARAYVPKIDGFVFDKTPVANEYAVISALINEYEWSFECGIFGNQTQAKFNEFKSKVEAAGLARLTTEFRNQYAAFLRDN
jgi:ABC-type glycerol-3-phosphate transport system substrate-binding protein